MNFEHTHERRTLAQSVSRYVADHYGEAPRRLVPRPARSFDRTHWNALADLGAVGILFEPEHGGYGGGPFDVMAVFEAVGRELIAEPFLACLMAGRTLAHGGGMHADWLERLAEGSLLASLAHCEPGGQWHPGDVRCSAYRSGGCWVLDGDKAGVPWGAQAGALVVSARTSGKPGDEHGVSLFLVPAGTAGLQVRDHPNLDGGRAADVKLQQLTLPPAALVGNPDEGAVALRDGIAHGVLALCAEATGAMDVAMAATLEYLKARKQFGEPIGSFQAVQHRMVDLMLHVEQSRSATINCAAHMETGSAARDRYAAAAKFTVGTAATHVAQECIQLHGGIGMSWELPVSHYAKRLALMNFQLGDEDFHLGRFVDLRLREEEDGRRHTT